ncbi:MAG: ABC transporter ATP-binding protein [Chloroflexi bacterium]|nr:MAG: ABC transporter ATP-binding protein [Chloroflexota bacterium]
MTAPKIELRGLGKIYPTPQGDVDALVDINLTVNDGEFLCIVGPSGCGKSTLLRILAGIYEETSGEIIVHKADIDRPLNSVVFQEYAIFPWRTTLDNIAFGLEMRGVPKPNRMAIARAYMEKVGLTRFADNYPNQLSGGMKQRVALARAMANDPEILLMDEPFGALDAQTREVMQEELLRIWEEDGGKTVVYITHSIDEAVMLGDRVVIMTAHPGRIKSIHPIDLPRPRTQQIRGTAEYAHIAQVIREDLSEEVDKAQAMERLES